MNGWRNDKTRSEDYNLLEKRLEGFPAGCFVDGLDRMPAAPQSGFSALRIRLDFIGEGTRILQLSLLLWCLSVPEA
jgi:hypothetical protein